MQGWLGSGQKGAVVLDNLNVTYLTKMDNTEISSLNATTEHSSHPGCLFHKDSGNCSAKFSRWYYSMAADTCTQFSWSGCGGNQNHFVSRKYCLDHCTGIPGTTQSPADVIEQNKDPEIVCAMPAHPGACKVNSDRFYFEPRSGKCEKFVYTGCRGNKNNFQSLKDCQDFCKSVMPDQNSKNKKTTMAPKVKTSLKTFAPAIITRVTPKPTTQSIVISEETTYPMKKPSLPSRAFEESVCGLNPDKGTCKGSNLRYFYNAWEEKCEEFHWSGCGVSCVNIFKIKFYILLLK